MLNIVNLLGTEEVFGSGLVGFLHNFGLHPHKAFLHD